MLIANKHASVVKMRANINRVSHFFENVVLAFCATIKAKQHCLKHLSWLLGDFHTVIKSFTRRVRSLQGMFWKKKYADGNKSSRGTRVWGDGAIRGHKLPIIRIMWVFTCRLSCSLSQLTERRLNYLPRPKLLLAERINSGGASLRHWHRLSRYKPRD